MRIGAKLDQIRSVCDQVFLAGRISDGERVVNEQGHGEVLERASFFFFNGGGPGGGGGEGNTGNSS